MNRPPVFWSVFSESTLTSVFVPGLEPRGTSDTSRYYLRNMYNRRYVLTYFIVFPQQGIHGNPSEYTQSPIVVSPLLQVRSHFFLHKDAFGSSSILTCTRLTCEELPRLCGVPPLSDSIYSQKPRIPSLLLHPSPDVKWAEEEEVLG